MTLRAVPKPEGFDLRVARAVKQESGKCWTPADILYDSSQLMEKFPATQACIVAWYTRDADGVLRIKYESSFEHDRQAIALAADLLADLQQ